LIVIFNDNGLDGILPMFCEIFGRSLRDLREQNTINDDGILAAGMILHYGRTHHLYS